MSTESVSPLRQRMIEDMNARKLCTGTQKGHVWTAPAVQEESDVLRSVRVQPCIRPVFASRLAPLRCGRYGRWP